MPQRCHFLYDAWASEHAIPLPRTLVPVPNLNAMRLRLLVIGLSVPWQSIFWFQARTTYCVLSPSFSCFPVHFLFCLYTFCITLSWILSTQHSNWVQKYCCYCPLDFMNEWHIEHIWSIAFVNTTLLQCVLRQISYHCYCCHSDSFVPCFAKKNQSAHLKKLCLLCTCQVFFRIIFTFSFLNYCSKISKISSRAPCPIYSRTLLVTILNIVCVHVHPKFSCYVAARIGGALKLILLSVDLSIYFTRDRNCLVNISFSNHSCQFMICSMYCEWL